MADGFPKMGIREDALGVWQRVRRPGWFLPLHLPKCIFYRRKITYLGISKYLWRQDMGREWNNLAVKDLLVSI